MCVGVTGLVYLKLKTLAGRAVGVSAERRGALSVGDTSGTDFVLSPGHFLLCEPGKETSPAPMRVLTREPDSSPCPAAVLVPAPTAPVGTTAGQVCLIPETKHREAALEQEEGWVSASTVPVRVPMTAVIITPLGEGGGMLPGGLKKVREPVKVSGASGRVNKRPAGWADPRR